MTHIEIRTSINRSKIGNTIDDISNRWGYEHYRPFINSLIKLEYLERIDSGRIKKLKKIPTDISIGELKRLSKGIKLPKRKVDGIWNVLIDFINSQPSDDILIIMEDLGYEYNWYRKTIRGYLSQLNSLEMIEYKKGGFDKHKGYHWKIKRLRQIPDKLSTALAKKMLYDEMYKRSAKIDKIKETLTNI